LRPPEPAGWPDIGLTLQRHISAISDDDRMLFPNSWPAPSLSTLSNEAVVCYRRGIAALVSGMAHADTMLGAALDADPDFYLAQVGLTVALTVMGAHFAVPTAPTGISRGERQHAEVVRTAFSGSRSHANDLRREHLLEYPGDLLIVWLPALSVWKHAAS
jgi:hypothetical protein